MQTFRCFGALQQPVTLYQLCNSDLVNIQRDLQVTHPTPTPHPSVLYDRHDIDVTLTNMTPEIQATKIVREKFPGENYTLNGKKLKHVKICK